MFLFVSIVGVISTLSAMSVFHEFLKNTQKGKSSSQTETEINNIVIPSFFVISVEILIGFMFGEAFGSTE